MRFLPLVLALSSFSAQAAVLESSRVKAFAYTQNEVGEWQTQCSFDFQQWVGDVYVDTVTVNTLTAEDGAFTSEVAVNGVNFHTDGCAADYVKSGYLSARVQATTGAYVYTGDLAWVSDTETLAYQFQDFRLPNCWKARVEVTSWCAEPVDNGNGSN